jgi:LmbE family N-acetylglucosaminyl deacetylase
MIRPSSALFIGAHCDDIELLAGATLARFCREGVRVGVLLFSDHRGVVSDIEAAQALGEFRENLRWLRAQTGAALEDHTTFLLPACRGAFEAERARIYEAMEKLRDRYDLVVTHPLSDTNQDHEQVSREARRVFKAHGSLLAGEFPNNELGETAVQVYLELEPGDVDAKVHMLSTYRSQRFGGRPYLDGSVARALARLRGSQIRAEAAEAFSVLGRVALRLP